MIRVGIDLVKISEFEDSLEKAGEGLLSKLFAPGELSAEYSSETIAGKFAVKEAFVKAMGKTLDSWHDIKVLNDKHGRPFVEGLPESIVEECDVSISHAGEYVTAIVILNLKGK